MAAFNCENQQTQEVLVRKLKEQIAEVCVFQMVQGSFVTISPANLVFLAKSVQIGQSLIFRAFSLTLSSELSLYKPEKNEVVNFVILYTIRMEVKLSQCWI